MKSTTSKLLFLVLLYAGWGGLTQAQEYRIVHCLLGCPTGAAQENPLVLRPIYALSYNEARRMADWVAYRVTAGTVGIASSLRREAAPDAAAYATLAPGDIAAAEAQGLLLGQQAPLVNFAGTPFWSDTNYLSNAVLRSQSLTQGAWNGLEWAIRNLVNRQEALYVLTGPVFDKQGEPRRLEGGEGHRVPDAFFKIVASGSGELAAFLMSQEARVGIHHCAQRVSLAEIEAATGLRFFPEAERSLAETLGPRLGCRDQGL